MYQQIFKLASKFLSDSLQLNESQAARLNTALGNGIGFDYFNYVLNKFGLSVGKKFANNKYYLNAEYGNIENAFLKGDHEGIRVVLGEPKPKKRKVPLDAYRSPAALYEKFNKDSAVIPVMVRIAADLEDLFSKYNVNPEVAEFLNKIPDENLRYYLPTIKSKPGITLEEVESISVPDKENINVPQYHEYDVALVNSINGLDGKYKEWALIQLTKLRREVNISKNWDNYAWFKLKLRQELTDWFDAEKPQIASYDWKTAIEASEAWHKAMAESGSGKVYTEGNKFIVYGPKWKNKEWNGWTIKRIYSKNDLEVEGNEMQHCVGSYADMVDAENTAIYSLRDPQNKPHVTIEESPPGSHEINQIQGKQNREPIKEYKEMIKEWFGVLGNVSLGDEDPQALIYEAINNIQYQQRGGFEESFNYYNDYGMETRFDGEDWEYAFDKLLEQIPKKNWNRTPGSGYIDAMEYVISKLIEWDKVHKTEHIKYVENELVKFEEKKFDIYLDWSDDAWARYRDAYPELSEEELNDKMQEDFEEEISREMPWTMINEAFELINNYRKEQKEE